VIVRSGDDIFCHGGPMSWAALPATAAWTHSGAQTGFEGLISQEHAKWTQGREQAEPGPRRAN
jgi:hypothetical protein